MISLSLPRSRNTCGWSNGGLAPTHMNSCEPISMRGTPASLWKCGTTLSAILFTLGGNDSERNQRDCAGFERPRTITADGVDSYGPRRPFCTAKFDTILSCERSPSFVGAVVSQNRHTIFRAGDGLAKRQDLRDCRWDGDGSARPWQ